MTTGTLLIRHVELLSPDGSLRTADVRISSHIDAIGQLEPSPGERTIEGAGALLIPGLNDHHVHLASYAASLTSCQCGPPAVNDETELAAAMAAVRGDGWLRGTGFHESVLPGLDRAWLDANGPDRPVRIQHRTGRLWIVNSRGLELIREKAGALPFHEKQRLENPDGRLYDIDELIGVVTREGMLPIDLASRRLAAFGITGINDMTPSNDVETWQWFSSLQACGDLLQKVRLSGRPAISDCHDTDRLFVGETKVHLHESALPDFRDLVNVITKSHRRSRNIAIHCVTEVELVFALSALRTAGTRQGDRIEHASVVPPALKAQLTELGLGVVTQPNFVRERGDAYLAEIPEGEHDYLYRCRSLIDAEIPLGFGTDMPFGHPDPWAAMGAATLRQTLSGQQLGKDECVSPGTALNCCLGSLDQPFKPRTISVGESADLCLLDAPWSEVQADIRSTQVTMTTIDGEVIYERD